MLTIVTYDHQNIFIVQATVLHPNPQMLDFAEQVSISERVKVTSGKRFYSTGLRALDFVSKHMLQLKPGATTFGRMTFSI